MVFRARANPQRSPEVWIFWSDIDEKVLWDASQKSPQEFADLIRANGSDVYVTPRKKEKVIT